MSAQDLITAVFLVAVSVFVALPFFKRGDKTDDGGGDES